MNDIRSMEPLDQATLKMGGYWNPLALVFKHKTDQATLKMGGYWNM